ncbi:BTAD domain-containing putative transcriptional regulator [Kitasatospora sp. NPDC008115]|uniref:AfsR/SARP family transcriptional regulator n=1 Tax=Kitasatospora sp. NPDC008115 TaxID=3364022 RepID=UPI0036E6140B
MGEAIWFGLLGPLEIRVAGAAVKVPSRVRTLLASLLCRPNQTVGVDELADAVWSNRPPRAATTTLRSHVLRLRRLLGEAAERVETTGSGYRIGLDPHTELDATIFTAKGESARGAARREDWQTVSRSAAAALELWRGVPLSDVPSDPLHRDEVPGWLEARIELTELAAHADLRLGRTAEAIRGLRRLGAEEPHREGVHALLIEALAAAGRRAEALAVYRRVRAALAADLGIEPGPQIAAVHQRVLGAGGAEPPRGPRRGPAPAEPARRSPAGPAPVTVLRQLPADLATFTGRGAELAALLDAATGPAGSPATVQVTVIEGMAGVGKTRLAVRAAHELARAGRFSQLQLYVNLRGFSRDHRPLDPSDVLEGLLRALGVDESRVPAGLDARAALFRDRLHGREALLLLDNAAGEPQVRPLVPAGPGCLVLVTSRRRLAGLDGASALPLDPLSPPEAVSLLAATVGADRVAAAEDAAERITRLCGRLPLALALAASRLRARPAWGLPDLADHLEHGGIRALVAGDRSLHTAFDHSYRGLPEPARRFLRLLAVHPGRDYTAHSTAELAALPPACAREALESLVDENLLIQDRPEHYRLHDLLHAFAVETAAAHPGAEEPAAGRV